MERSQNVMPPGERHAQEVTDLDIFFLLTSLIFSYRFIGLEIDISI